MAARLVLGVNPAAGRGRAVAEAERAASRLHGAGHEVRIVQAEDADRLERAMRSAVATGPDGLVAVGGDGTVHLAVNAVAQTGVPLAVLPLGTGNDIVRGFGLPTDAAAGVAALLEALSSDAGPRPMDAVRTSTGRWFASMLSAGFDAAVNERANRMTRLSGTPRYVAAVLLEVARLQPRRYRIVIDRDTRHLDAVLVTVGNTSSIGGGMRLAPAARPDDGLLDVLVATPLPRRALLRLLPKVFDGSHVGDSHVSFERGRVITIDVDDRGRPPVAYADGERLGPLPVTVEVVPGALALLG